jgi:hypothetical protein
MWKSIDKMQTGITPKDFHHFGTSNNEFYYFLTAHKSAPLIIFGKDAMGSKMQHAHYLCIENEIGKYVHGDGAQIGKKISVPARFVVAKYHQTKYFFDKVEDLKEKLSSGKPVPEEEELTIQL